MGKFHLFLVRIIIVFILFRLSSGASSGGSSDSSGSPPSSSSTPPAEGKKSVSPAPLERQRKPQKKQRKVDMNHSVDVLEMLETAGRSYLGGQCFSDDTDSHDETHPSPPKGGVAPRTTTSDSAHGHNGMQHKVPPRSKIEHVHSSPNLSSAAQGLSPRATSPREIPHGQVGVSRPSHPSPQKPVLNAQNQQQKKLSSPNLRQNHAPTTTGPGSSPLIGRGLMQHSVSFDQVRSSHTVTPPMHYGGHGGRSNSMFGGSPYAAYYAAATGRAYHSAYLPSRSHSAAAGVPEDNSIVRKLFQMPPSEVPTTTGSVSTGNVSTGSVSLQTLFSQAATPISGGPRLSSSTGSPQGLPRQHHRQAPPPTALALSLDEIEKKLTEEAPSPSPKGLAKDTAPEMAPTTSSNGGNTVLMQPSAFVMPPPPVASTTTTIAVEPPTPLSEEPQVFPSVPPLMHSAGMTAPPLNSQPIPAPTGSPKKAKTARHTATVSSNQIQPQGLPNHTPKGVASVVATKEPLSAIQEVHTPPCGSTTTATAASGDSSNLVRV